MPRSGIVAYQQATAHLGAAPAPSGPPAVDWTRISRPDLAPKPLPTPDGLGANSPLPAADVVVVTWTSAEWDALSLVFTSELASTSHRTWQSYGRGFVDAWPQLFAQSLWNSSALKADTSPSLTATSNVSDSTDRWGFFRLVQVGALRVLLFKSQLHVSTDGVTLPLIEMTRRILADTGARLLLSAGTSGAAQPTDRVGDVAVSNGAHIRLSGVLATSELNGCTFQSPWQPDFAFMADAESLMLKTTAPTVLAPAIGYPLDQHIAYADGDRAPKAHNYSDPFKPVLTTNGFDVATNDAASPYLSYCCLEMDDGLLAMACNEAGRSFASVRNLSDPVMNKDLPASLANALSAFIYVSCGTNSSYNGALAAWALIAAFK